MPQKYRFLDPKVISKIPSMELRARLVVEGFITGIHKSPYHGFNVEFAEHRQYMPGDDIKYVDWKVYGKSDRFFIKMFEEETNLKCYLLLDSSNSMGFGSAGITKLEYGSYLAAALSYLMLKQKDAVGLCVFDTEMRHFLPPRGSGGHIYHILDLLDRVSPGSKTDISKTLHDLAERIKRRGLVMVISDFLDDPQKILKGLKHFRHKKHEVIVFHLIDPAEMNFPFEGNAIFKDLETEESLAADTGSLKKSYQREFGSFIKTLKTGCAQSFIDYVPMETDKPLDEALLRYLEKRKIK
jgi:uncharacterized protein (DUF58 family)